MRKSIAILIVSTSLVAGCAMLHSYNDGEIASLEEFDQLMWAQYKGTGDAFDLIGKKQLVEADFAAISAAGKRLGLTAPRLREQQFSKGPQFDHFAETLAAHAAELVTAASARDAVSAQAALEATKQTCAACHKKFK
jgi:hypothetical protein